MPGRPRGPSLSAPETRESRLAMSGEMIILLAVIATFNLGPLIAIAICVRNQNKRDGGGADA